MDKKNSTVEKDFLASIEASPELASLARDVGILQAGSIPSLQRISNNQDRSSMGAMNVQPSMAQFDKIGSRKKRPHENLESNSYNARIPAVSSTTSSKRRKTGDGMTKRSEVNPKNQKGLRHFSMKVCEKVKEKGTTTYNEVADELVREFALLKDLDPDSSGKSYDEKNIRRRVYDALNVLMAMDIVQKAKKEIIWKGLPSNAAQDLERLEREKISRINSIAKKKKQLEDLLMQQIAFRNLINRNEKRLDTPLDQRIPLPFIVVNTSQETVVKCEMGEDRTDIFFSFTKPFEINDDNEILKRMGMNHTTKKDLPKLIPHQLIQYLPQDYVNNLPEDDTGYMMSTSSTSDIGTLAIPVSATLSKPTSNTI